jgi:hypothetical protein
MKRFWSSNLVTLANQKSTTSSCIDNFRFCLSINKNGRIIHFQWMNQTTKRKAPPGRAVLTRTTRKDKHRKYRPISEMRNALKLNLLWSVKISWSISHELNNSHHVCEKKSFTLGSYNLTKTYCYQLSDKIKTQSQVFLVW